MRTKTSRRWGDTLIPLHRVVVLCDTKKNDEMSCLFLELKRGNVMGKLNDFNWGEIHGNEFAERSYQNGIVKT